MSQIDFYEDNNKKLKVIKVASEMFLDKGYVGTSVLDIANAAGINKTAVFYRFSSKEKIAKEVLAYLYRFYEETIFMRLNFPAAGKKESVLLLSKFLATSLSMKDNAVLLFFILKSVDSLEVKELAGRNLKRWLDKLTMVLRPIHGEEKAIHMANYSLYFIMGCSMMRQMKHGSAITVEELCRQLEGFWLKNEFRV